MRITHATKRSVSVEGKTLHADEDGVIDVPADLAVHLFHPMHGFELSDKVKLRPDTPKRGRPQGSPNRPKKVVDQDDDSVLPA